MKTIFHIAEAADWEAAQGVGAYQAASLATEGFIHLSTAEQLPGVAERYYRGRTGLVLLHVDPTRLTAALRWETVYDGQDPFPHLYGPLDLAAVVRAEPFPA